MSSDNLNQSNKTYQYAVFIGRFQPIHKGHLFVFNEALSVADKLIILIGSSHGARTLRNPFTYEERVTMISQSVPQALLDRIIFKPLQDFTYNDSAWVENIHQQVDHITQKASTALIGHSKDESTYYLKLFPSWSYVEVGNLEGINATVQRNQFLSGNISNISSSIMPKPALDWLKSFSLTQQFEGLQSHYHYISSIRSDLQSIDYPISHTELLLVINHREHILVTKNQVNPQQPLYTLPLFTPNKDKLISDFLLAKLKQLIPLTHHTSVKLDHPIIFDDPKRSEIGKVIGLCYPLDLSKLGDSSTVFPPLKSDYFWLEKSQLNRKNTYQDHYFILDSIYKNLVKN